ncbi:hypothetical protein [Polaribacter sp. Asnod1-A03]|uniref:hypothetical protein n=1 Tax=Polaribacter sp. Asnod1-A03 TaxID=3160581 RepID=UPI00386544A3
MKFNFFKSKKKNNTSKEEEEEVNSMGFTKTEIEEYDKHVKFYYTNIINSLILYTYNEKQLDKMETILIDPLTELYEELDYAFTPILFETVLKNRLIDTKFKNELLEFKIKVDEIPTEIWNWNYLDTNETWKNIRNDADELLNKLGINTRKYNDEFTTIISNTGEILKKGNSNLK